MRTHSFAHGEAIFSPPSSAGAFGISLGTVDGQLNFAVRIEEGVYREMTGYKCPVTAGKWSFVSGRYDGSSMYMNVDGYVCQFKHFTQAPFSEKALFPEESTSGIAIGRELAAEMVTGAPEDKRIFQGEIYAVSMKSSAAFSVSDTHCLPSETASDLVQYGNLRTQGGETNFAMRLEGPKGVPGSYSDDTDGSYTFRYTPAVPGHYRMYMGHGGSPVFSYGGYTCVGGTKTGRDYCTLDLTSSDGVEKPFCVAASLPGHPKMKPMPSQLLMQT